MKENVLIQTMLDNEMIVFGGDNPVKGVDIKSPFGLFFQKMANTSGFYHDLALHLENKIPSEINCIAGLGYEGILLGREIAALSGRLFFAAQQSTSSGKLAGLAGDAPLKGNNIALITGVIATGNTIAGSLELIKKAGGKCNLVYSIFDYGFHLKKTITNFINEGLTIHSLVTSELLGSYLQMMNNANCRSIEVWISKNHNYFKKGSRTKSLL